MPRAAAAIFLSSAIVLTACGGDDDGGSGGDSAVILTSESLRPIVTRLAEAFKREAPDSDLEVSVGTSAEVRKRATEGDGNVYIDGRGPIAATRKDNEDVGEAVSFGHDLMQVVTQQGNPKKITGVEIFGIADAKTAICAEKTRCGRLARQVLKKAKITQPADVQAKGGTQVVDQVASGAVDAGLLLRTSVQNHNAKVDGITVPEKQNVNLVYQALLVSESDTATRFLDFITSARGKQILQAAGLLP